MRKTAMAIAFSVAVIMLAPIVSAGGGNGGPNGGGNWGKKVLPLTVDFEAVEASSDAYGWMNWSSTLDEFKFDFHGYNLVDGVYYCLAYTTGEPEVGDPVIGWGTADVDETCPTGIVRVHIKGEIAWPDVTGATFSLVGYPSVDGELVLVSDEPIDLVQKL